MNMVKVLITLAAKIIGGTLKKDIPLAKLNLT
jgi:hypothetical protein